MAKQNSNKEQLETQNKLAREYVDILKQTKAAMSELKKSLKGNLDEQSLITDETKEAISLAQTLAGFTVEQLSSKREEANFTAKLSKVTQKEVSMQVEINSLLAKKNTANTNHAKVLQDQLNTSKKASIEAQKTLALYKKIGKETKFFDSMSNLVKEVPILRKLFPEMEEAAKAAREAAANNESAWKAAGKSMLSVASKLITASALKLLWDGLNKVDGSIQNIGRSLNLGDNAARELFKNLTKSGDYTSDQLIKGVIQLNSELGTAAAIPLEIAETMATLTEKMGVSASIVSKLFTIAASAGKGFKEYTASLIGGVKALNASTNSAIDYKAIMEDIAQAGAATRLSLNQFPGGIAKAAFEARKLGLTLMQLEKTQSGLLDFESSISAELEAELMTGRSLNLENARMFALKNDIVGLTSELAKQDITQAKFGKMNYLAQEAIAKALGMSRNEMAEMFEKQKAQAKMAEFALKIKDSELGTEGKIQALMSNGMSLSEATKQLGIDELKYRKEHATVQERQALLMDKMLTAGEAFFNVLEPIKGVLKFAADHAKILLSILMSIAALRFGRGLMNFSKSFKPMASDAAKAAASLKKSERAKLQPKVGGKFIKGPKLPVAPGLAQKGLGKVVPKLAAKGLGKSLGGMIPGLGLAFALNAAMEGDWVSAGLNAGAGIASFFPGPGTAIAGGLGAIDIGRHVYKAVQPVEKDTQMATGGIVTKPTRALVGEAGAEAVIPLTALYAKFDELIAAVNKGGSVYIDGNKAGEALMLGSYKLS